MATATLLGSWVAPDLTPHTGRVIAIIDDPNRVGTGVIGGSSTAVLVNGALPDTGPGTLKVSVPTSGKAVYTIRERLDDVAEQTYKITVLSSDTVIDLSTRPS